MKNISMLLLMLLASVGLVAQNLYFPPTSSNQWARTAPSTLNWCPLKIAALYQYLNQEQTKSFILLKDGKIVLERYFNGHSQSSTYNWNSAGKSLRSFLIGIAQEEGLLDINDRSSVHLGTSWTNLPWYKERLITVRNQLSMTSGLDEAFFNCTSPWCLRYKADAGTRWVYHNGPYNLLKEVLQNASGLSLNNFTDTRVQNKIAMGSGSWVTTGPFTIFNSTARDMARFGLLMLGNGDWNGQVVLGDQTYFDAMIQSSQNLNPSYGYLWWLNGKNSFIPPGTSVSVSGAIAPDAPLDVYVAAGKGGQFISVSPANGLVMIRQGDLGGDELAPLGFHNEIWKRIMDLECTGQSRQAGQQMEAESSIRIWPNPATERIYLSGPAAENVTWQLMDLSGRLIKVQKGQAFMRLNGIPKGLYFLYLDTGQEQQVEKLLIK